MSYADIDYTMKNWGPKTVYDKKEEVMYFT